MVDRALITELLQSGANAEWFWSSPDATEETNPDAEARIVLLWSPFG